ncbi:uncharacterized protein LOC128387025 [Panonychus citri]|uniref:uncharacterized protein LOC128387025 n=1 Tax=Panonychus citri TaxID=50023 RepID=UPI0023076558|nr:uncharacterized protein LOC128387025 [Panonychus citri]
MNLNSLLHQSLSIIGCLYLIALLLSMTTVNCNQESNEWKYFNELGTSPIDLTNKLEEKRGINLGRKVMDPRNCAGLLADTSPYQRNVVYRRAEGFLHPDSDSRDSISRSLDSRLPILPDNGRY